MFMVTELEDFTFIWHARCIYMFGGSLYCFCRDTYSVHDAPSKTTRDDMFSMALVDGLLLLVQQLNTRNSSVTSYMTLHDIFAYWD